MKRIVTFGEIMMRLNPEGRLGLIQAGGGCDVAPLPHIREAGRRLIALDNPLQGV